MIPFNYSSRMTSSIQLLLIGALTFFLVTSYVIPVVTNFIVLTDVISPDASQKPLFTDILSTAVIFVILAVLLFWIAALIYRIISGNFLKPRKEEGFKKTFIILSLFFVGGQIISVSCYYVNDELLILYLIMSLVSFAFLPIILGFGFYAEYQAPAKSYVYNEQERLSDVDIENAKRMALYEEYHANRQSYETFQSDLRECIGSHQKVNLLVRSGEDDKGAHLIPAFNPKRLYGHRGMSNEELRWFGGSFSCKSFDDLVSMSENGLPTFVFQYLGRNMFRAYADIIKLKAKYPNIHIFVFQSNWFFESKIEMQKELKEKGIGIYLDLLRNEFKKDEHDHENRFNIFQEIKDALNQNN